MKSFYHATIMGNHDKYIKYINDYILLQNIKMEKAVLNENKTEEYKAYLRKQDAVIQLNWTLKGL